MNAFVQEVKSVEMLSEELKLEKKPKSIIEQEQLIWIIWRTHCRGETKQVKRRWTFKWNWITEKIILRNWKKKTTTIKLIKMGRACEKLVLQQGNVKVVGYKVL